MAQFGLVRVVSNAELLEQERAQQAAQAQRQRFESSLASHIRKQWEINKQAKQPIERRLLKCLRQRNGEYDPEVLAEIRAQGGSEIFMQLTATKCRAAASWIRDVLLPDGQRAWGLEPTPIPDVPPIVLEFLQQQVQAELMAMVEQGEQVTPQMAQAALEEAKQTALKHAREYAADAAEKMEEKIADQLAEGGWQEALEEFIDDFATFPAAILKGPVLRQRGSFRWGDDFQPEQTTELRYECQRVSPFDIYPSPGAMHIDDGTLIERVRFDRRDLYAMIGQPGYQEDAIRAVLTDYGRGGLRLWLWNESERARLEGRENEYLHSQEGLIDGLHYWGGAQGLLLLQWGMPPELIPDPLAEYEIEAILIGEHVIRCEINDDPMRRRPYQKASFQRVPGAWWGTCPPELMADIQRACNAAARALMNNLGIASGPQVEVYADRFADGEEVTQIYPWKVWQMKSDPAGGANNRAINFFQPQSNAAELLAVFEAFERRADDATNIPRYAYGNERVGGAGATASGLAMLMDSASKGIKSAIANIDAGVIRPAIEKYWFNNMLYDPDESIKGDCKVVARGASVLIAKDQANARRLEMLQATANPVDMQIIGVDGRAELLHETFKSMDLPDVIPDRETMQQRLAEQQQNQPPDPKLVAEERKAKEAEAKLELEAARLEQSDRQHQQTLLARLEEAAMRLEAQAMRGGR